MKENPYKVLGVLETATEDEIKKAYHKIVKRYHPDSYVNHSKEVQDKA